MTQEQSLGQFTVPRASRKRRLLAIVIDMHLFASLWTLGTLWLVPFFDSLLVRIAAFTALESILVPLRYSPGLYMLSIFRYTDESGDFLGVDPEVKQNESWPTMILATLLVNDGWKSAVRWTMGYPPRPYFGAIPDSVVSPLADIAFGAAEFFVAFAIFRMARAGLWSGLALAALLMLSTGLSWEVFPQYVEEYAAYRAVLRGSSVPPELVSAMAPVVFFGTLAVSAILGLVVIAYRGRFTNCLRAA